jgi:hypothetical protein
MYKKTLTYEDFNGKSHTEDLYFNLTKAELTELQLSHEGGFADYLQQIVDAQDIPTLAKVFKEIVLMSYGEKTADGRRFVKRNADGKRISEEFVDSAAYDALYTELFTNDKAASEFINSILPKLDNVPNASHPALMTNT